MATLIVGGVTTELAQAPVEESPIEIGDRARAFDGTLRSTIRSRKYRWSCVTIPMTQADATTLETALNGTLPVACSGDITGSINAHPEITSVQYIPVSNGYRVVTSFTLHQA